VSAGGSRRPLTSVAPRKSNVNVTLDHATRPYDLLLSELRFLHGSSRLEDSFYFVFRFGGQTSRLYCDSDGYEKAG
jgi:hypothetical protein